VVGGTKFYERQEIKDAFGYLVSIANPRDDFATRRILNVPKRGIGDATETAIASFAENNGISMRAALTHINELGFGPKITTAVGALSDMLNEISATIETDPVDLVLKNVLEKSGYLASLRASRDPQDEARVENLEELVGVAKDFQRNNPEGRLPDFLNEVALVAAADDLDDESGTVSLMTLHTAKGLEFPIVFLAGLEEGLLPHKMSFVVPGGMQEERRLFYVGITRAKQKLYLSLAMTRSLYGESDSTMPSRYLQEIPQQLIEWRESGAGTGSPRRFTPSIADDLGYRAVEKPKTEWKGAINTIRNNEGLQLVPGDMVNHDAFGKGKVVSVNGEGSKQTAEINFGSNGVKRLLVKVAPIQKL
jgi:DNA helicase-2/ATP-dependent DNA helicase PcrA